MFDQKRVQTASEEDSMGPRLSTNSPEERDSCADRGITFRVKCFPNDGILSPKSSEVAHFFCLIIVVYLGHGIFHPR